ncbi:ABC transporter ATP-binding protein [Kineosporia sp. R_H_3]|uniref:ABC transporter ATP-binding protein n=1 Tax=Kineosporia sp. R_H_3 TaxID=1961848 RepID=UPI000B4AB80F|nr:ABC transporter ATP-binding protein [Kineosporia sp. R_H_3]
MTDAPALAVDGLRKSYGGRPVVDGLSFAARSGEVTAVLGPNGAGKTTTVECCEGLRHPDGGTVRVLGRDPWRADAALRARVGVMLQDGGLPTGARAGEVLRHVAALHARPLPVTDLLDRLGLTAHARTNVRRLSGGLRQRLALAVAVVGRPEVVFLDEPTAGLDPQARLAVWDVVAQLRTDGAAVVLTTHLMDEAERLADRVVVVDHGRVVADGSPAALLSGHGESLRFGGPPGLDVGQLGAALTAGISVQEVSPGQYVVSGGPDAPLGPQAVATVTAWCAGLGVMPDGLSLGRPTLEDLFLDLTGRDLR